MSKKQKQKTINEYLFEGQRQGCIEHTRASKRVIHRDHFVIDLGWDQLPHSIGVRFVEQRKQHHRLRFASDRFTHLTKLHRHGLAETLTHELGQCVHVTDIHIAEDLFAGGQAILVVVNRRVDFENVFVADCGSLNSVGENAVQWIVPHGFDVLGIVIIGAFIAWVLVRWNAKQSLLLHVILVRRSDATNI